ncbi:MAG TPA: hypothetical protein PKA98_05120, partial [Acidimicrobiales bacterium]|nr:hypothetical protein [Acidimicrobiales bacterium]
MRPGAVRPAEAAARAEAQERVWDLVWRRRLVYFATVAASLLLASFPWLGTPSTIASPFGIVADAIRAAGAVLPGIADPWIEAFALRPGSFLAGALVVACLMTWNSRIGAEIPDGMRAIWTSAGRVPYRAGRVFRLRTHPLYRRFFRWLKWYAAPTAFAGGLAFAILVVLSRGLFLVGSSFGLVCGSEAPPVAVAGRVEREGFVTS